MGREIFRNRPPCFRICIRILFGGRGMVTGALVKRVALAGIRWVSTSRKLVPILLSGIAGCVLLYFLLCPLRPFNQVVSRIIAEPDACVGIHAQLNTMDDLI